MEQWSTHLLFSSSSTVPKGHWQPGTQSGAQGAGFKFWHVTGHVVPHSIYSWPSMGQLVAINIHTDVVWKSMIFVVLPFDEGVGTSVANNKDKYTHHS